MAEAERSSRGLLYPIFEQALAVEDGPCVVEVVAFGDVLEMGAKFEEAAIAPPLRQDFGRGTVYARPPASEFLQQGQIEIRS